MRGTVKHGGLWLSASLLGASLLMTARFAVEGRGGAPASRGLGAHRDITVRYAARLPQLPEDAREIRLWIPLAQTSAEQEIRQRSIHAPSPYSITREPAYGNDILYLALRPPWPRTWRARRGRARR